MAKQKEFDLTITLRSVDGIKTKKFQKLIDELVSAGLDEIVGVEDGNLVPVGVTASEPRKVGEQTEELLEAVKGADIFDYDGPNVNSAPYEEGEYDDVPEDYAGPSGQDIPQYTFPAPSATQPLPSAGSLYVNTVNMDTAKQASE